MGVQSLNLNRSILNQSRNLNRSILSHNLNQLLQDLSLQSLSLSLSHLSQIMVMIIVTAITIMNGMNLMTATTITTIITIIGLMIMEMMIRVIGGVRTTITIGSAIGISKPTISTSCIAFGIFLI